MIEYVLDYMENKGICASSKDEHEKLIKGISKYLKENGIGEDDGGKYYEIFITNHLNSIADKDLKAYFANYDLISKVNQIAIEINCGIQISQERKTSLRNAMAELCSGGLGEAYVPIYEVKQALEK